MRGAGHIGRFFHQEERMKEKLMQVLLGNIDNDDKDLMAELQFLMNEFPQQSRQYKALCNLYAYFYYIQEDEVNMIEELSDSPAPMVAASLRALGLIGDTARDENITSLVLQSAEMAWLINRDHAKESMN